MPAGIPPVRAHPGKPFRNWQDAARAGQIVTITCGTCSRTANYLPEDLAKVTRPDWPVHVCPFVCPSCKDPEVMRVRLTVPTAADSLTLLVRRPVKPIQRWIWKTMPLTER